MTVREVYDRGVKNLPAMEQLRLASLILEQLTHSEPAAAGNLMEQISLNTPANTTLLQLAATQVPPQSWWDETDDPTVAA